MARKNTNPSVEVPTQETRCRSFDIRDLMADVEYFSKHELGKPNLNEAVRVLLRKGIESYKREKQIIQQFTPQATNNAIQAIG